MAVIELPNQLYTKLQALAESEQTTPVDLIARLIQLNSALPQSFESLLRRVVREELNMVVQNQPETFYLTPTMPLYEDMLELTKRKSRNEIELYSHQEVWGE
jgi:predicted DNA-binding ribbon-helix-helix protein